MTVSIWRDDSPQAPSLGRVDVAIIGGGIAGLSIARELVRCGHTPWIIEARELAAGATGRNAGFAMTGLADHYATLCSTYGRQTARELWLVSQRNLNTLLNTVVGAEGIDADVVRCGSIVAAWNHEEAALIEASASLLQQDGFEVQVLRGDALFERTHSRRFETGLFVPADAGVHPVKIVRGLARKLRDAGVRILESHEVRALVSSHDGVEVHTQRGVVTARSVVLATNAYTPNLDAWFSPYVRPVRGQALCTEPTAFRVPSLLYTDDGFQYARQLPDGRLVAGGCRRQYADTEVGTDDITTSSVQLDIEHFVHTTWPELATVPISHRWSGSMGFSVDGIPLVGRLPDRPNILFAIGFTGHGMGFAFETAACVSALITGNSPPTNVFDASRISRMP